MRIAFLGLGKMGSAITDHLLRDHAVTVWNRSSGATLEAAEKGATIAASPKEAVKDAELVFTMLMDDAAHEHVLFEQDALVSMPEGGVLVTLSTISVALAERLVTKTADKGVSYLGCPVFGRPEVAKAGKLYLVAAGQVALLEKARPALQSFSRKIQLVGDHPPSAHAFKLCGNFLIASVIASLSEAAHTASDSQIRPELFLSTVNEALFQSPFYDAYGKLLLNPPAEPGATLALGEKDVRLFRDAANERGSMTPIAQLLGSWFEKGMSEGLENRDWAGAWYAMTATQERQERTSTKESA
jgi:3-hydroxyisobutyrate dehydrogenase-like beta-hydroxyacid dehydrogenase